MVLNYFRQLRKQQRALTFHRQLIRQGDFIFDIGAHEGKRTSLYQYLGARVLSLEPQSEVFKILEERFEKGKAIITLNLAVGEKEGKAEIKIGNHSQTSSLSNDFIERLPNLHDLKWEKTETVNITTLDLLIQSYGVPDYIKIDVEGYEKKVLMGLSSAVKIISFEYNFPFKEEAIKCVELIKKLGDYEYNFMPFEEMVFQSDKRMNFSEIKDFLNNAPDGLLTGEVFAFINSEFKM